MTSVRRSIEIPASRTETTEAWRQFLDSVLVGHRRLACDEVACVSATDAGIIEFDALAGDRTRVTLNIVTPEEQTEQERELLEHKASHDLVLFWSYIDGGDYAAERGRPSEDERRGGAHTLKEHVRNDSEEFSLRRSFRS
jgi:hypothetical protein